MDMEIAALHSGGTSQAVLTFLSQPLWRDEKKLISLPLYTQNLMRICSGRDSQARNGRGDPVDKQSD